MNAAKRHDGEPWVMSAVLGLFKHPEWVRQGVYFVMLWGIITYGNSTVKAYVQSQKDELMEPMNQLRADVTVLKQEMIKKREFRKFLKSWDSAHPEMPATPMFDDVINDSAGLYGDNHGEDVWLAWIHARYGFP